MTTPRGVCQLCGKDLPRRLGRGRPRRWCSVSHRRAGEAILRRLRADLDAVAFVVAAGFREDFVEFIKQVAIDNARRAEAIQDAAQNHASAAELDEAVLAAEWPADG